MVLVERIDKFDAKGTKCLVMGYCEGTKTYRLMRFQTKNIIKSRDMVFMEDSMSVGNVLDIRPNGRNEGPTAVVVDEPYNNDEECEEQVEDHLIANEEAIEILVENDDRVKRVGKDERYPMMK